MFKKWLRMRVFFCVLNRVLFVLLVLSLSPRLINDFASKGFGLCTQSTFLCARPNRLFAYDRVNHLATLWIRLRRSFPTHSDTLTFPYSLVLTHTFWFFLLASLAVGVPIRRSCAIKNRPSSLGAKQLCCAQHLWCVREVVGGCVVDHTKSGR